MEMLISNETKNSFEENISKDSKGEVSRRTFLSMASLVALESASLAATNDIDGGFAFIEDKAIPDRETPIVPPGAFGVAHLAHHCTGCQLCITLCPNQVLRPSKRLKSWMQPEMSYERGYCRPECTRCSSVCPSGAILPVTVAEKAAIQLGNAVWSKDRCLVNTKGIRCGVCARHCPTGAIHMASRDRDNVASPRIPVIDPERCIGCGACENLCPSRPLSAIYVEGKDRHREV